MSKRERTTVYVLTGLIAFGIFALIYGLHILNPTYVDWMMRDGDQPQNYIGAQAYRQSPWLFPIGNLNTLRYPDVSSVIFTDSIPMLAVFYKLLSPLLPFPCQYVGIWALLCFELQGFLAARLLEKYLKKPEQILLGTAFFLISPIMVFRLFDHWSLGGQWILLLTALLPVYYREKYSDPKKAALLALLAGALAPAIHMYFVVECGMIVAFFCLYDLIVQKKARRIIGPVCVLAAFACGALASMYLLGGFGNDEIVNAGGFRIYSYNLNGLFNPVWFSKILPGMTIRTGQIEGFSYLGLGMMALLLISVVYLVKAIRRKEWSWAVVIPVILFAVCSVIVSTSDRITLGDREVFSFNLPQKLTDLWAIFRSTGRFIWPLYYLLMYIAVVGTVRVSGRKIGAVLLAACLALQVYDLSPLYASRHFPGDYVYTSSLTETEWDGLVEKNGIRHLVLIGGEDNEEELIRKEYVLGEYAIRHQLTMNRFRMSHGQFSYRDRAEEAIFDDTTDSLFLFTDAAEAEPYKDRLELAELDGYTVGTKVKQETYE